MRSWNLNTVCMIYWIIFFQETSDEYKENLPTFRSIERTINPLIVPMSIKLDFKHHINAMRIALNSNVYCIFNSIAHSRRQLRILKSFFFH